MSQRKEDSSWREALATLKIQKTLAARQAVVAVVKEADAKQGTGQRYDDNDAAANPEADRGQGTREGAARNKREPKPPPQKVRTPMLLDVS